MLTFFLPLFHLTTSPLFYIYLASFHLLFKLTSASVSTLVVAAGVVTVVIVANDSAAGVAGVSGVVGVAVDAVFAVVAVAVLLLPLLLLLLLLLLPLLLLLLLLLYIRGLHLEAKALHVLHGDVVHARRREGMNALAM